MKSTLALISNSLNCREKKKRVTILTSHDWSNTLEVKPAVYLVEGVLPHISAGQRLIKGKHHRVVFSIWLMAPLSDPAFIVCEWVMETPERGLRTLRLNDGQEISTVFLKFQRLEADLPYVISVHVPFGPAVYDPVSELSATSTSQHHTWLTKKILPLASMHRSELTFTQKLQSGHLWGNQKYQKCQIKEKKVIYIQRDWTIFIWRAT